MLLWMLLGASCSDTGLNDPDDDVVEPVVVEERFVQAPWPELDVLFVVDATGSMAEEQAGIASAAPEFLARLDELGVLWQVGVTTTDLDDGGALQGRPWILTPSTEGAAALLADALLVGTDRPPPSAALDAATLALADADGLNLGFRRRDAALHVVFVSDADDESGEVLGTDVVGNFLNVLAAEEAATAHPARASAVVDDGSGACDAPGYDTLPGTRFVQVAEESGGRVASICTDDFASVADALGDVGVEGGHLFPLQAVPADGSVVVEVDGARVTEGWIVDPALPALLFAEPPPLDAIIVVTYEIAS